MKRFFLTTLLFSTILIKAESIVIDGILDEPEWTNAYSISEFYQTSPFNLQKSQVKPWSTYFQMKMEFMLVSLTNKAIHLCYLKKLLETR